MAPMNDTYHGVPYPTMWENMDTMRRRAWQAGVMSAVGHLGLAEARKLAAELEAVNGPVSPVRPDDLSDAKLAVYRTLRGVSSGAFATSDTKIPQSLANMLANVIVDDLKGRGWGDLSGARIDLHAMKIQYQETIKECNEALRKATGGRS